MLYYIHDEHKAMGDSHERARDCLYYQLSCDPVGDVMSAGNLVMITRAAIGVPCGTIALCLKCEKKRGDYDNGHSIWCVLLMNGKLRGQHRRYLDIDLEVL